jgi:hypothetical protein
MEHLHIQYQFKNTNGNKRNAGVTQLNKIDELANKNTIITMITTLPSIFDFKLVYYTIDSLRMEIGEI